jgi:hypothetical protein
MLPAELLAIPALSFHLPFQYAGSGAESPRADNPRDGGAQCQAWGTACASRTNVPGVVQALGRLLLGKTVDDTCAVVVDQGGKPILLLYFSLRWVNVTPSVNDLTGLVGLGCSSRFSCWGLRPCSPR